MKPMIFKNFGGLYQMQVAGDADLQRIEVLDAARWAATSAPTRDLHCDPVFLAFLDPERTGRIRVSQLVAARDWMYERLSGRARLHEKTDTLVLADLDTAREAGRHLLHAAEHVLSHLGETDTSRIGLAQVRTFRAGYAQSLANGDGVVPPEALPEPEAAALAADVLEIVGGAPDASGKPGVGEEHVALFLEKGQAYLDWKARPAADERILPFGDATAEMASLVQALDAKIEAYFWTCDLLRQEVGLLEALKATAQELAALRPPSAAAIEEYLAASPLAPPLPDGSLPLAAGVNPFYREQFDALRTQVLEKLLPERQDSLTRASWRSVKSVFAPYLAWLAAKPAEPFEKLDESRLAAHLAGAAAERLRHYIGVDAAAAAELAHMADLERLTLYQRYLIELVNNFVNFSAIYHPVETALVDMGSLIIDGRRLELTIRVENRGEHKKLAAESLIFLVYAAITERDGNVAFEVVAPVTSGNKGRLRIGKRGIFVDNAGREWDAQIVDIAENPISLAEAIRAPFRRAADFIRMKFEDLADAKLSASERAIAQKLDQKLTSTAAPAAGKPSGTVSAPSGGGLQMMLLTGSVALAALGSATAYIVSAVVNISPLKALGAVASIAGVVIVISAVLGWLKLRRRDMSLLLEANGWALNVHMGITGRLGRLFTRTPALPKGSRKDRTDILLAFLEEERDAARAKTRRRRRIVVLAFFVLAAAVLYVWLEHWGGRTVAGPWLDSLWSSASRAAPETP
jgi:hypothetical protein